MTDMVLLIWEKKLRKFVKMQKNYFHQVYSERIYDEEHLAETITKLNRDTQLHLLCASKNVWGCRK